MHFPTKKMGVIFCVAKKDTTGVGGGPEGVLFFGRNFSRLSFLNISLMHIITFWSFNTGQIKYNLHSADEEYSEDPLGWRG